MRVLLISHTCQSRVFGQVKAEILGRMPGLDLQVLIPDRWREYGTWRKADSPKESDPHEDGARYHVGSVCWPWTGPGQWYLHWYPELRRLLEEFRPDVIDLWEEPWGLVSAHACWLRNRVLPKAKIITETEQNVQKSLPFPFEAFRSYTLKNAAFAIGRNSEAIEVLRRKGYNGKSTVVPNGVDATLFRPLDRAACRSELGVQGCVAGYVGRLVEEKGVMDMVEALKYCDPEINLLFVGSGSMRDPLLQRAAELGKGNQIRVLSERTLESLPRIFNALDVLVLPSHTTPRWKEQFGRVIIEAHASGTPVIGSDSGAIPNVVGEGGLIVPERNPNELGNAMTRLSKDPILRESLGLKGRKRVTEWCTWEKVAEAMYDIYMQVGAGSALQTA